MTLKYSFFLLLAFCLIQSCRSPSNLKKNNGTSQGDGDNVSHDKEILLEDSVKLGMLSNGLKYYLKKNKKKEGEIDLHLIIKIGSILEEENQIGAAHMIARLFTKNDSLSHIKKSTKKLYNDINFYSGFDETIYHVKISSSTDSLLEEGIRLLRSWLGTRNFSLADLAEEKKVLRRELESDKTIEDNIQENFLPVYLKFSRYPDRLPKGTLKGLRNLSRKSILNFYKDWYRPELAAVSIVGEIDVDKVESKLINILSEVTPPDNIKPRRGYIIPVLEEANAVAVPIPNLKKNRIIFSFKEGAESFLNIENTYQKEAVASILLSALNNKFRLEEKKQNRLFEKITVQYQHKFRGLKPFSISLLLDESVPIDTAVSSFLDLIIDMRREGFQESYIDKIKQELIVEKQNVYSQLDSIPSENYFYEIQENFLRNRPIISPSKKLEMYKKNISAVSLQQVESLFDKLLKSTNPVIGVFFQIGTKKSKYSKADFLNILIEKLDEINTIEHSNIVLPDFGKRPIPNKIVYKKHIKEVDAHLWRLYNGANVITKQVPTSESPDMIYFFAISKGGSSMYKNSTDFHYLKTVPYAMKALKLGEYSPDFLKKILDKRNISINPYINTHTESLKGAFPSKETETALQVYHLLATASQGDTLSLQLLKEDMIVRDKLRKQNMDKVFKDSIAYTMHEYYQTEIPFHLRKRDSLQEAYKNFQKKAPKLFKERFQNTGDFTFFFVGDINLKTFEVLVKRYLSSIQLNQSPEVWKKVGRPYNEKQIRRVYKDSRVKDTCHVSMYQRKEASYSIVKSNLVSLFAKVLKNRLEKKYVNIESGVFLISVEASLHSKPDSFFEISIKFKCEPKRQKELIYSILGELENIKANGFRKEELISVNAQSVEAYKDHANKANAIISLLVDYFFYNNTTGSTLSQINQAYTISNSQAKNIISTYIDIEKFSNHTFLSK